eukprot:jgi/Galph1/3943/GphlegSOOS_G2590.1
MSLFRPALYHKLTDLTALTNMMKQKVSSLGANMKNASSNKTRQSLALGTLGLSAMIAFYSWNQKKLKLDSQETKEKQLSKLTPEDFQPVTLVSSTPYNHNVARLRFAIQSSENEDFPAVSFVLLKTKDADGKDVIRPYNPVSGVSAKGYFELLVKKYPESKMGSFLHSRKPGDIVLVKGPNRQYPYQANSKKHIAFVAGGTGITPVYQLIDYILSNPEDKTKITLIYANRTPQDTLLKSELDSLQKKFSDRMTVCYTVDKPDGQWKGRQGYVSKEMLKEYLPGPSSENLIFVCGPAPMMESISGTKTPEKKQGQLSGMLKEMGYTEEHVWKF